MFWIIRWYPYSLKFLHAIFYYCPQRMCTSVIWISPQKTSIIGPVTGFTQDALLLTTYTTPRPDVLIRLFQCQSSERSFTLSTDDTNDCNWSFHLFISQTVDDPVLYEAITTLQILPILSFLNYFKFLRNCLLCASSCQQYLIYSSCNLLKPL